MDRLSAAVIILLLAVIALLSWLLIAKPVEAPTVNNVPPVARQSPQPLPPPPTAAMPLSSRVKVTSPLKNATVGKTFTVTGEAPGAWYFEASFPVLVQDKDGNKIGQIAAQAQGVWMTEKQVPFIAKLIISGNYTGPATLVLLKDNPSGMPENDDSVSFPITIK